MDGTEGLDDGPYRVYHVVCQLIYLNEGPIALNEQGIAGRCKQHILAFRRNLKALLDLGKLVLIDGRLSNNRAATELEYVDNHRAISAKGGRGSAGIAKGSKRGRKEVQPKSQVDDASNQLKTNGQATAALLDTQHQETRQDETRRDKRKVDAPSGASSAAAPTPSKSSFIPDDHALAERIMLAQGLHKQDQRVIGTSYFAKKWRDAGWSPDVIVNTIERIMARRTEAPRSAQYFEQAIADAHEELKRGVPRGTTGPPQRRQRQSFFDLAIELENRANERAEHPAAAAAALIDAKSGDVIAD